MFRCSQKLAMQLRRGVLAVARAGRLLSSYQNEPDGANFMFHGIVQVTWATPPSSADLSRFSAETEKEVDDWIYEAMLNGLADTMKEPEKYDFDRYWG